LRPEIVLDGTAQSGRECVRLGAGAQPFRTSDNGLIHIVAASRFHIVVFVAPPGHLISGDGDAPVRRTLVPCDRELTLAGRGGSHDGRIRLVAIPCNHHPVVSEVRFVVVVGPWALGVSNRAPDTPLVLVSGGQPGQDVRLSSADVYRLAPTAPFAPPVVCIVVGA